MNEQLGTISQRLDRKFGDRIRNLGTRIRSSLPRFKPLPAVKWMWKNRKKVMYASLGACVAVKLLKRNFRRSRKPFTVLQPIYLPSSIAGPSGVKTSS